MRIPPALRPAPALAALLLVGLSACNSKSHTIVADDVPDDQKAALAHAKPVELPPAILATKTYRCADSSVVYLDWFSGNQSANLRTKKGGTPTKVTAPAPGQPLVADGGYSVSGTSDDKTVKIAVAGGKEQSCNS